MNLKLLFRIMKLFSNAKIREVFFRDVNNYFTDYRRTFYERFNKETAPKGFAIRSGSVAEDEVLFETHVHFNDKNNLSNLVENLFNKEIGIIALTNHDSNEIFSCLRNNLTGDYNFIKSDDNYFVIRKENKNLLFLRAQEKTTNIGDLGLIGYTGNPPKKLRDYKKIIDWTHEHGGVVVANHPLFTSGPVYGVMHERDSRSLFDVLDKDENAFAYLKNKGVDLFELNAKTVRFPLTSEIFETYAIALRNNLRLTVGSDIHETPSKLGFNGILIKKRTFNEILASENPWDTLKKKVLLNNKRTSNKILVSENPWDTLKKVLLNNNYKLLLNGVDLEDLFYNSN